MNMTMTAIREHSTYGEPQPERKKCGSVQCQQSRLIKKYRDDLTRTRDEFSKLHALPKTAFLIAETIEVDKLPTAAFNTLNRLRNHRRYGEKTNMHDLSLQGCIQFTIQESEYKLTHRTYLYNTLENM
jgi:hypothetical protein